MDSSELSLDRIQEYLADLGYQGVPEETLLQLKGELLRRMASGMRDTDQDYEDDHEEAPIRHRRRKQRRHSVEAEEDVPRDELHPQPLTHDRGYVSAHVPEQPRTAPTPQRKIHRQDIDEYEKYYDPHEDGRPSSGYYKQRPTSGDSYSNMRLSRKTNSARPMGQSSGYGQPFYRQSTQVSQRYGADGTDPYGLTAKSAMFNSGTSKYTLKEKKLRKSDPVSNWARYTDMWNVQGGLDDVRKRETQPKYMNSAAIRSAVYRPAYD